MGRVFNQNSRPARDPLNKLDGSIIATGNTTTPYWNASDLVTTCDDWGVAWNPSFSGSQGVCITDNTGLELTRQYWQSPAATTAFATNGGGTAATNMWSGSSRIFGLNVPQRPSTIAIMGQCVGAATCSGTARVYDLTNTTAVQQCSSSVSFTSSWSVATFACNLSTAVTGDILAFKIDTITNTGTNYNLAYISVQPPNDDEHNWLANNGLPVTAGTPGPTTILKVVDTTGAGLVTGPTSVTSGDMATFNGTTGKIQDGGAPPAALLTVVPSWLQYYCDGAEGALNITSGNQTITPGVHCFTTCNVSVGAVEAAFGSTVTGPLVLFCSTSATIAGTLGFSPNVSGSGSNNSNSNFGGSGAGGGGGAAGGTAGNGNEGNINGGGGGTSSGGAGSNGSAATASLQKMFVAGMNSPVNGFLCGGAQGGAGGSTGGSAGRGGGCIVVVSPSINFTGTIDVSGGSGAAAAANSTGSGGGGGGGTVILRSPSLTNSGTVQVSGGQGGNCFNPAIVLSSPTGTIQTNSATTWGSAHVSTFSGGNPTVITVDNAGTGYNFTPTCTVSGTGGGANTGSGATCTVTMTGSAPNQTISSIAVSGGNAGYGTGTTYTTCGKGGDGAPGWVKTFNQ